MQDFKLPSYLKELKEIEDFPKPLIQNTHLDLIELPEFTSQIKSIESFHSGIILNTGDFNDVLISSNSLLHNPEKVYNNSKSSIESLEKVNKDLLGKVGPDSYKSAGLVEAKTFGGTVVDVLSQGAKDLIGLDGDWGDGNAWKNLAKKTIGDLLQVDKNNTPLKDLGSKNSKKKFLKSDTIIIDSTTIIRKTAGDRFQLSSSHLYDTFNPGHEGGVYLKEDIEGSEVTPRIKTAILNPSNILHKIITSKNYQTNFYIAWFTVKPNKSNESNIFIGDNGTALFYLDNIKINTIKPGDPIKKSFGFTDLVLMSDANIKGDSTISFDLLETSFLDMRTLIYSYMEFQPGQIYGGDTDSNLTEISLHIVTPYGNNGKKPIYLHMVAEDLRFFKVPGIDFSNSSKDQQILTISAVCRKTKLRLEEDSDE